MPSSLLLSQGFRKSSFNPPWVRVRPSWAPCRPGISHSYRVSCLFASVPAQHSNSAFLHCRVVWCTGPLCRWVRSIYPGSAGSWVQSLAWNKDKTQNSFCCLCLSNGLSVLQLTNFSLVPVHWRTAYTGLCGFLWATFLCFSQQSGDGTVESIFIFLRRKEAGDKSPEKWGVWTPFLGLSSVSPSVSVTCSRPTSLTSYGFYHEDIP